MTACAACDHPDSGYLHTCHGSGTFRAAEAHASGEVEEQAIRDWPRFHVDVHFQVRALNEAMVRDKLTGLVTAILSDDLVEHSDFSIRELVA